MSIVVYRIERHGWAPVDAGLYMSGLAFESGLYDREEFNMGGRNPTPENDGIHMQSYAGWFSGFQNNEQMIDWVGIKNIISLHRHGGVVRIYDVTEAAVVFGNKQLMFRMDDAKLVTEVELLSAGENYARDKLNELERMLAAPSTKEPSSYTTAPV